MASNKLPRLFVAERFDFIYDLFLNITTIWRPVSVARNASRCVAAVMPYASMAGTPEISSCSDMSFGKTTPGTRDVPVLR